MIGPNETGLAVLGAAMGGAALKLIERIFARAEKQLVVDASTRQSVDNEHTQMRDELRKDNLFLRTEMIRLQGELDTWREKYYGLLPKFNDLITATELAKKANGKSVQAPGAAQP